MVRGDFIMEQTLFDIVDKYGLFTALVVYILWANKQREDRYIEREEKYISVIDKLSDSFEDLKKDVSGIKSKLWGDGSE